jgi:MYXO-CTERM domain-containing protein
VRRLVALCALISLGLAGRGARAAEVEALRQAGPADKRFNIAVLGDGYRVADQAKLTTDAKAIIDYLFGVTPLKQYAQFFNVKLVHVISNDNGADNGTYGATRDTALGAYFNCDGIDRLLCIDDGKAATAAATDVPEYNFAIVLVNDPKYGGSGGPVCASSSNEQSFEVLAHEIGHSLAHLADEYSYEGNQPPCNQQKDCNEANATLRNARDQIKWKDWIEPATPIPTPATDQYGALTGLFEGARYTPTGVYRPQLNCKMRDLGADYCSVCTEQFVKSIWTADNIQMIEGGLPAQAAVQSASCDAIALSVTLPPITPSTYRFTWSVDGKPQQETTGAIQLLPGVLMAGEHKVELAVEDATAMVRTDPNSVMKDQHSWSVSVAKSDCPAPVGGAAGAGPAAGGAAGVAGGGVGGMLASSGAGGAVGIAGAGAGAGTAGAATGGAGGGPSGVAGSGVVTPTRVAPPPRDSSGCGCSVPGQPSRSAALPFAGLALALTLGRRRRQVRRA